jgi:hypothetical protein
VGTSSKTMFTRRADGQGDTVIADRLNVIDANMTFYSMVIIDQELQEGDW